MFFNKKKGKEITRKEFIENGTSTPTERTITQYIPSEYELTSAEKSRINELNNICDDYKLNNEIREKLVKSPFGDISNKLTKFPTFHPKFNGEVFNDFPIEDWDYIFDFADCTKINSEEFKEVIDMCKKHDDKIYYPAIQRLLTLNHNLNGYGMDEYLSLKEFNEIYLSIIDDIRGNSLYWYADNAFFTLISRRIHKEHVAIYELLFEKYKHCTHY
jgi:hypothetical protein